MVENLGCCGLLQACCHRHDPEKYIIEGTFEIHHSPWLSLCATGLSVAVRLYSQDKVDPITGKVIESENAYIMKGKVLERKKHTIKCMDVGTKVLKFRLKFEVAQDFGIPGAFVVENKDKHEFFLKSAALHYINHPDFPEKRRFDFYCVSWVYPISKTGIQFKRIFFRDQLYLPKETPKGIVELREKELQELRGGSKDERKPWDRIYEYDCYNDLGDPDNSRLLARPVLGGDSNRYPYPRRLRTGRPPCHQDHLSESRPASCWEIYVPPDERLSHDKLEELKDNFVNALIRFLTPNSNHPPILDQKCPDFFLKIGHFFVPKAALSMEDYKFIQPIVNFFRRKPPSQHQDPSSSNAFEMVENIFADKEVKELEESVKQKLQEVVPKEIFDQVVAAATERKPLSSQLPSIITGNIYAWAEDKEFGRQMLAGTNPVRIRRLREKDLSVVMKSNWPLVDLPSLEKAMSDENKLFILEHHDYLEPFLKMIIEKGVCAYATRTILKVEEVGSTKESIVPVLIELSLPDDSDGETRVLSQEDEFAWELAKMHVACNDAAYHQLVSHWLHTHAVVEPFIIGTRRQLSVMHPIHRLLDPHFKDTLHINALARAIFLNAGGIFETTLFTGEFSMRLSSHLYKQWRFDEQALPTDLLKRGMATRKPNKSTNTIRDENDIIEKPADQTEPAKADEVVNPVELDENPTGIDEDVVELDDNPVITDTTEQSPDNEFDAGVNLVLEDYPYAKDGLEIWVAIETWVRDYCRIFYRTSNDIIHDEELQEWWSEIRDVGHADQKQGWYSIECLADLVKALTTLIWITTGLHAAVNFGQYGYNGWPFNRPMLLRKFVPSTVSEIEVEAIDDFIKQMLPEKFQMEFVIAVMDVLSRHTSDEVYLGQTSHGKNWGMDEIDEKLKKIDEKLKGFKEKLERIEGNIKKRNKEYGLMNRWGEYAKIPYKLLYPDTSKTMPRSNEKGKHEKMDINERGIPNSISI